MCLIINIVYVFNKSILHINFDMFIFLTKNSCQLFRSKQSFRWQKLKRTYCGAVHAQLQRIEYRPNVILHVYVPTESIRDLIRVRLVKYWKRSYKYILTNNLETITVHFCYNSTRYMYVLNVSLKPRLGRFLL